MKKKLLNIALSLVIAIGTAIPTVTAQTDYDTSDETLYNNIVEFTSQYEYHEGDYEKSASLYPDVPYSSGIEQTKDGKEYELPIYYNDKDAGIVSDYDLKTGISAKVLVNGKSNTTSAYALHNDVLLLPASVFEKLGCKVSFDKKLYVTTITKNGTTLEILPQLRAMRKDKADGFYVPLKAPARFINDVVYVPAEAVAYEFGYGTEWNKSKKQVTFTEGKATPKETEKPQATAKPTPAQTESPSLEMTSTPANEAEMNAPKILSVKGGENVIISLNGLNITFPYDAQPYIDDNGRTQIPIRVVAELLSCGVVWNDETKTAVITNKNGDIVKIAINSNVLTKNSEKIEMDTAAIIKDDRTYIPVRFVAEAMGLTVEWQN